MQSHGESEPDPVSRMCCYYELREAQHHFRICAFRSSVISTVWYIVTSLRLCTIRLVSAAQHTETSWPLNPLQC